MNSDQGSQFTSVGWIEAMTRHGIKISMDGKGRCLDNITIERFWRSIKYEEVYLKAYESLVEARKAIAAYMEFYNSVRPHQALITKRLIRFMKKKSKEKTIESLLRKS